MITFSYSYVLLMTNNLEPLEHDYLRLLYVLLQTNHLEPLEHDYFRLCAVTDQSFRIIRT